MDKAEEDVQGGGGCTRRWFTLQMPSSTFIGSHWVSYHRVYLEDTSKQIFVVIYWLVEEMPTLIKSG